MGLAMQHEGAAPRANEQWAELYHERSTLGAEWLASQSRTRRHLQVQAPRVSVERIGTHRPTEQPEVLSRRPCHPAPKRARLGFGFVDHGNQFEVAGPEWDDPISRSPGRVMSTLRRRQPISGREGWRSS